jgi:hypothetical protein
MKKANTCEPMNPSGKVFCGKNSRDFVQDTIFRIGKLQDHVEKAGMQIANAMSRSLFIKTDRSGGNDV